MVDFVLASPLPMNLLLGRDLVQIYNDAYRAVMGSKHPQGLGQPAAECWPEVWDVAGPLYDRVFAGEAVTVDHHEWTLIRDGRPEETWFDAYLTPVRDEAGAVVGAHVTAFEITRQVQLSADRRRATQALRRSEARLQMAADLVGLASYTWWPATGEVDWDERMRPLWGLPPDAPVDAAVALAGVHPDDRPRVEAIMAEHAHPVAGSMYQIEYRVLGADGVERWVSTRARALAEPGRGVGFVGTIRDITEDKRAIEALRASEQRLQAAIDLADLGCYTRDPRTNAVHWDARVKAMWGLGPDAAVGRDLFMAGVHPDDRARVKAALAGRLDPAGNGVYESEYRVIGIGDGIERWVATRSQTIFDHGRPVRIFGVVLDATERKNAEQAKEVLVAELQHRTRNILAVVRAISAKTRSASASLEDYAVEFNDRLGALARVQGLLARGDDLDITLAELVRMELDAVAGEPDGQRIVVGGPDVSVPRNWVQPLALALHELATNSLKYGALDSPGGRLAVTWRLTDESDGLRRLALEWVESGVLTAGEPVRSKRRGYGRELIEQALPYQLSARTRFDVLDDGLQCLIDLPLGPGRR